jgi:hypothetical protein
MRPWWYESVRSINRHGDFIFGSVTINDPPSYFTDRTVELSDYNDKMASDKFGGFVKALRNQKINLPNVYCPFQCTEYCDKCGEAHWDVIIQHALKSTSIPLSDNTRYDNLRNFDHMHEGYFRKENDYDCILLNPDWPILPTLIITENNGPIILTCSLHGNGSDLYKLYPPRPIHHNLCSRQTDQLSHVTIKPRTIRPTKRKQFCTTFSQCKMIGTFSGIDSCWISTHSDWSRPCPILTDHEARSIAGRSDMLHLLHKKTNDGSLPQCAAEMLVDYASTEYPSELTQPSIDGSTFIPVSYVYKIQVSRMKESKSGSKIEVVDKHDEVNFCRRPWPRFINIVQKEDSQGYGQMFRTIPQLNSGKDRPAMTPLYLLSMVSSVNKLYELIDSKPGQWRYDGMEGNLLAMIRKQCFSYLRRPCESKCPFKGDMPFKDFIDLIQNLHPTTFDDMLDHNRHYQFSTEFMRSLFNQDTYPTIDVIGSVSDLPSRDEVFYSSKDVIIIATESVPDVDELQQIRNGIHFRDDVSFSLLHIAISVAETNVYCTNSNRFDFIRFMRHPGYSKWWKQERSDKFVSKCDDNHDPITLLQSFCRHSDEHYITSIFVFVRDQDFQVDEYQLQFLESLGGKCHVRCRCNNFPLIPTFRPPDKKKKCSKCSQKKESYICANLQCQTRICKSCHDSYPSDDVTYVEQTTSDLDDDIDSESGDDEYHDSVSDDDSVASDSTSSSDSTFFSASSNLSDTTPKPLDITEQIDILDDEPDPEAAKEADLLLFNEYDACQYAEVEDSDVVPFLTTEAGDKPATFDDVDSDKFWHPAYIMLNNVSSCTVRNGRKQINPCQRDRFMIQSLVSTTPGTATPLTYPEAAMMPRHFPQAASVDSSSILGALPVWAVGGDSSYYGFENTATVTRQRITASGSTMSTDTHYVKHRFEVSANQFLSKSDSRKSPFGTAFMVDKSSKTGIAHNTFDESRLTDSVESNMIVLGLCATQEHIKHDIFGTVTCNQSRTPGTDFVYEWVRSDDWAKHIKDYDTMTAPQKAEYERCIDEASSPIFLRQWIQYRTAFINQLKKKISEKGGRSLALTNRDEYQKDSGNLPHMHFILACNKSGMGPDAEQFIMDLIRTSPFEVVRQSDVETMINEGLLEDTYQMNEYNQLACDILCHKNCTERCQMRIGDGDGPSNFKCRKPHPVFDSPDPSCHSFTNLPHSFSPEFTEAMTRMRFCTEENGVPKFSHPFFNPTRHFAPCIANCRFNMSPIIPSWFLASESMVNAQYIGNKDQSGKYCFKYSFKPDTSERVETAVNAHDGSIQTDVIFQHNMKIATSKFNEEKAAAKSRKKDNVTGEIVAHLAIWQKCLLIPDMDTDHTFICVNTRDFESRQRSKIELQGSGKVRRDKKVGRNRDGTERQPDHQYDDIYLDTVRKSIRPELRPQQQLTQAQLDILFDDRVDNRKYDKISEFGVRPPELVPVFSRLKHYYRLCVVSNEFTPNIMDLLCIAPLTRCRWIDGFGRMIRLRKSTLSEVLAHVNSNLEKLSNVEDTEDISFAREINRAILFIIRLYNGDESTLNETELMFKEEGFLGDFVHDDGLPLPPTILHSQINPMNAQQWIIHFILTHGNYITEQDALDHATFRECLVKTKLIGESNEVEDLEDYAYTVCAIYVNDEVIRLGISMNKAEHFILRALRIFQEVIMRDSLPMFEIPFTHTQLYDNLDVSNDAFWETSNRKVLDSVYYAVRNTPNIPSREAVEAVPHMGLLEGFRPSEHLVRSPNQSQASYEEQKLAFQLIEYTVQKKNNAVQGRSISNYVKNAVVHGAPGSGKTFVGMVAILYCICNGLRVIPTALQAARAVVIGGIHVHPLFCLPVNRNKNAKLNPTRIAELALQKIMNNPRILYTLLTVEVIFLDEAGQLAAEILHAIDIILRTIRKSTALYGGVTIIATMDHTQLQPIKNTPFLCSSHILGGYTFVKLQRSVRAHNDPDLQIIQALTREDPFELQRNPDKKRTWFRILRRILTCVPSLDDNRITANARVVFSRKVLARELVERQTDRNIANYRRQGIRHEVVRSQDFVKRSSLAEWSPADDATRRRMNTHFREPNKLVFAEYVLFECTYNAQNRDYLHTNLALMIKVPDSETIRSRKRIKLLLVPSHLDHIEFLDSPDRSTYPSEEELIDQGWKPIFIHCIDREENVGNVRTRRKQYAIRHIGAGTIDSVQGATIYSLFVFECTLRNRPWMKSQVVVLLSRVLHHRQMLCIGDRTQVIEHLWNLICMPTQWTKMMDRKLHLLSINSEGNAPDRYTFDTDSVLPYRICDYQLPEFDTGYVYLLCSMRVSTYTYIGQCKSIRKRLSAHNSGNGAFGSSDPSLQPFYIAGFISGFESYNRHRLQVLESKWHHKRDQSSDRASVLGLIRIGEKITQDTNQFNLSNGSLSLLTFTVLVTSS